MNYELAAELVYRLMCHYFDGNEELVEGWLQNADPFLGYVSPLTLMKSGNHENVLQFVRGIVNKKVSMHGK